MFVCKLCYHFCKCGFTGSVCWKHRLTFMLKARLWRYRCQLSFSLYFHSDAQFSLSLSCWCLAHAAVTTALNRVGLFLSLSLSFSEEDKQPLLFMMSASWMDTEQQQASNAPRRLMQTLQVLLKLSIITSFTTSSCIIWLKPSECPLVSTVPHYCTKPNFIHTYMLYMYYALLDNVKLK